VVNGKYVPPPNRNEFGTTLWPPTSVASRIGCLPCVISSNDALVEGESWLASLLTSFEDSFNPPLPNSFEDSFNPPSSSPCTELGSAVPVLPAETGERTQRVQPSRGPHRGAQRKEVTSALYLQEGDPRRRALRDMPFARALQRARFLHHRGGVVPDNLFAFVRAHADPVVRDVLERVGELY